MTIHFSNDEMKYIETSGVDFKMKCKEDTPEDVKKALDGRIKSFNKWVDEINGRNLMSNSQNGE